MKYIIVIIFLTSLYSCNFPKHYFNPAPTCENTNMQMEYDSPDYSVNNVHAILKVNHPNEYRYYFKTFIEEDGINKILVNFRDKNLCMDVLLSIDSLGKLNGMKRTNGKSYPRELYDLQWELDERFGKLEVMYTDMHDIID